MMEEAPHRRTADLDLPSGFHRSHRPSSADGSEGGNVEAEVGAGAARYRNSMDIQLKADETIGEMVDETRALALTGEEGYSMSGEAGVDVVGVGVENGVRAGVGD